MLLLFIPLVSAYFEQKLTRQVYPYKDLDLSEIVTNQQPSLCPNDLLKYIHNDTYVSQICFDKNVFYNVEVVLGENVTNQTIFNLALDLSSPWTWYKAPTCISCKKMNPLEFEIDDECKKSSRKQCFSGEFTQKYNATKWNDRNIQGQIYSQDSLIQGKFQTDTIQLLAYDSSQKLTIRQWISYEWGNLTPPALANVTGLQMLQVEYINTDVPILADGALGLGFGYKETNEDKAQMDTDFVQKLVQEKTQLNLTRQQFAIYTYNNSNSFELVIQIGGFDYKYVHKRNENVKWVNNMENSAYYWMLEVNEVKYAHGDQDLVKYELPVKKAILTLNSQFIELPYSWLIKLALGLEQLHSGTKCDLVDSDMYVLYCKNLHYETFIVDYTLTFVFGQNVVPIDNRHLLVRSCNQSTQGSMFQDCAFNIKVSTSDYVILGEPFMRNHYIVFENQPGNDIRRIGIMQTAIHEYYPENPTVYEWPLFQAILMIFIFGILSICSVTFMRSICKDLFRALKYRKTATFEDQQSLRVSKDIDYVDYSTSEDLSNKIKESEESEQQKKEEEWKKSQEQFNFGSKFASSIEQNSL